MREKFKQAYLFFFLFIFKQIFFLQVAVADIQFGPMRFHPDQLQVIIYHAVIFTLIFFKDGEGEGLKLYIENNLRF